jgi:hypothetical protein
VDDTVADDDVSLRIFPWLFSFDGEAPAVEITTVEKGRPSFVFAVEQRSAEKCENGVADQVRKHGDRGTGLDHF